MSHEAMSAKSSVVSARSGRNTGESKRGARGSGIRLVSTSCGQLKEKAQEPFSFFGNGHPKRRTALQEPIRFAAGVSNWSGTVIPSNSSSGKSFQNLRSAEEEAGM